MVRKSRSTFFTARSMVRGFSVEGTRLKIKLLVHLPHRKARFSGRSMCTHNYLEVRCGAGGRNREVLNSLNVLLKIFLLYKDNVDFTVSRDFWAENNLSCHTDKLIFQMRKQPKKSSGLAWLECRWGHGWRILVPGTELPPALGEQGKAEMWQRTRAPLRMGSNRGSPSQGD